MINAATSAIAVGFSLVGLAGAVYVTAYAVGVWRGRWWSWRDRLAAAALFVVTLPIIGGWLILIWALRPTE